MSVREYIGARYVPVFADPVEWSNNRTFEPLTIVTYQGNSYTSKQYVPQGITIQDTNYWALTSNFNSQVESYRQEVQRLSGVVDDLSDDLTTETDNRVAADSALDARIDALEPLNIEQLILIGDSWLVDNYGRTLWSMIRDKLGIKAGKCFNYGTSAAGFIKESPTPFPTQLNNAISNASIDKNAPTAIVVIGGTNDFNAGYTTATQYATVINNMQAAINSNFTHAKTVFFFMQAAVDRQYQNILIKNVQGNTPGVNVINASWPIAKTKFTDNLHLTPAGERDFAQFVAANFGIGSYANPSASISFITEATELFGDVFTSANLYESWTETSSTSWVFLRLKSQVAIDGMRGYVSNLTLPCPTHKAGSPGNIISFGLPTDFHFTPEFVTADGAGRIGFRNLSALNATWYSGVSNEVGVA